MKKRSSGQLALVIISLGLAWEAPSQAQEFSVLYNFGSNSGDLQKPVAPAVVAQGRDGSLYSTTPNGGASNVGGVFKITTAGAMTVLYSFDGIHGSQPYSGLTLGEDGYLYGTTVIGGALNQGTVFKIAPGGTLTVLHDFVGSEGGNPYAPPIQGTDGNFYGTTYAGGTQGSGTIYKLTRSGVLTSLHSFNTTDGWLPYGPLVQGTDGSFYGTTEWGGTGGGGGTIFKIKADGEFTNLYNFDGTHGKFPYAALIEASDGRFYGTTEEGGTSNTGVVFRIATDGKFTILHNFNFNGNPGGSASFDGLLQATDGNIYGAPTEGGTNGYGTIYRMNTHGHLSVLYDFVSTLATNPEATLVQHTNGILYGDTTTGGTAGWGTFYSFDVGLKPFISLVSTSGKIGKTIGILGQGFKGTTAVSFNGTTATFNVVSSTYLTATVPAGATNGFVTVTTPRRKLTSSKKFRVN